MSSIINTINWKQVKSKRLQLQCGYGYIGSTRLYQQSSFLSVLLESSWSQQSVFNFIEARKDNTDDQPQPLLSFSQCSELYTVANTLPEPSIILAPLEFSASPSPVLTQLYIQPCAIRSRNVCLNPVLYICACLSSIIFIMHTFDSSKVQAAIHSSLTHIALFIFHICESNSSLSVNHTDSNFGCTP